MQLASRRRRGTSSSMLLTVVVRVSLEHSLLSPLVPVAPVGWIIVSSTSRTKSIAQSEMPVFTDASS